MNISQFSSHFKGSVVEGKCYSPEESRDMAKHQYDDLNGDIDVYNSCMYKREKYKVGLLQQINK